MVDKYETSSTGPRPLVTKNTMAIIPVESDEFTLGKDDWDARIDQGTRGTDLMIQVITLQDVIFIQNTFILLYCTRYS